jgi:hypothetical protein
MAFALYRPCLKAFLLPLGAPGDRPPCSRHRPFGIAGDRHPLPLLVRAPHRRLRCIGDLLCMGLILKFRGNPSPRGPDHADDSLTAGMHVDVLHRHLLLALAAMPVQERRAAPCMCEKACWLGSGSHFGPRTSAQEASRAGNIPGGRRAR